MRTNSFRLKIALLSGAISGGLLIAAGVLFWQLAYRMDLARVDRELRNLGSPQLERVNGGDHWVRFEGALSFVAGTDQPPTFILWVKHEDRVLHQSKHWPADIAPASFPELTDYEAPFRLEPGQLPPPPPRRAEPISAQNPGLPRKEPQFFTREAGGRQWRFGVMGNPYLTFVLGADLAGFSAGMTQLRNAFLGALPVVLLLVGAGAWLLASRALQPVTALTQTAEGITARGLDQRIAAPAHDREFVRLIMVFNAMLDRLERSFHQATRFSADAAHELRTPLTIMQGEIEAALQHAPIGSEQQRVFSDLLEEIQRLKSITQKLLLLSQADAGQLKPALAPFDLSEAVAEVCEDAALLGPHLRLEQDIATSLHVAADPELLGQVLQNLTTNAIKYNQDGGFVRFTLKPDGEHVLLRITNSGEPIPAAEREKVFHRFYRGAARQQKIDGVGLGLSLSREIVRAHGGELILEQSTDAGTTFAVRLPLA
jgi:two-component system, OmpR family, heavy metal sensor histidine kinase CusS